MKTRSESPAAQQHGFSQLCLSTPARRILLLAALAEGTTTVENLLDSDDIR